MPRIVFLILLLFCPFSVARAEVITCPTPVKNGVLIEVGHVTPQEGDTYTNAIEQDIGGDYDEKAPQIEWNFLNLDDNTTPAIVHCFVDKKGLKTVDITVPETIKRCILRKDKFECRSGTVSCTGYVDHVVIEAMGEGEIKPEKHRGKSSVWKRLDERPKGAKLVARCSDRYSTTGDVQTLDIPNGTKECVFAKRRFICTDTPEIHDAFWPKE